MEVCAINIDLARANSDIEKTWMNQLAKLAKEMLSQSVKQVVIEVPRMPTPSRKCMSPECGQRIPASVLAQGLCLDHYIEEVFRKLDATTDCFRRREGVDHEILGWLLIQVDCLIESIRGETTALDPSQKSKLLEVLLGIANLSEYVRHHTADDPRNPYKRNAAYARVRLGATTARD